MDTLWQIVLTEWRVIKDAPLLFSAAVLTGVVLAGLAIWWAMEWRYGGQIEIKDSTIESQAKWLEEYRHKLQAESPEDGLKKLEEIKDRELSLVEQKVEENADGTYTISTVMQVVSPTPPATLYIKAEAIGIIEMNVEKIGPQPSLLFSMNQERITPNTISWKINSPSGRFLITVRAKESNGTLHYRYDKRID